MRSVIASLATLAIAGPSFSRAFLIPPSLNLEIASDSLPGSLAAAGQNRQVAIDCKHCPFYEGSIDGIEVWSKKHNSLLLEFSTKPGILNVNGHPLLTTVNPKSFTPLKAYQIPGSAKDFSANKAVDKTALHEVKLGFEVFAARTHPGVMNARLHVLSVGFMQTMKHMDIVEVNLIEDGKGGFIIYDAVARKPTQREAAVSHCRFNALCRWKMYMMDMLMKLRSKKQRPCPDSLKIPALTNADHSEHKTANPKHSDLLDVFRHRHFADLKHAHDHVRGPHHHHHHHHHGPHRMSKICIVFRYVIMPLILTCIVGTLGFTAGLMLYLAYSKLFKKSRGNDEHDELDKLDILEEEGLLSDKDREFEEEQLPAYTDSPDGDRH